MRSWSVRKRAEMENEEVTIIGMPGSIKFQLPGIPSINLDFYERSGFNLLLKFKTNGFYSKRFVFP
jgi:hypothetical protein